MDHSVLCVELGLEVLYVEDGLDLRLCHTLPIVICA